MSKLKNTLRAVAALSINKTSQSKEMYMYLTEAWKEVKHDPELVTMFLRNLFFILSVQREHYLYKKKGIKGKPIGAQEFRSARIIYLWLLGNVKKWTKNNLHLFFEYCSWKLLLYNQVTTTKGSRKNPATFVSHEHTIVKPKMLAKLIAKVIREQDPTLGLLAKWLPKIATGRYRYNTVHVGKQLKPGKREVHGRVNGKRVNSEIILKKGDVVTTKRKLTKPALDRREINMELINAICEQMDWSHSDYIAFRSNYLKDTPEHLFSTKKIKNFTKQDFLSWLDKCSAGQQAVVARRLTNKKKDKLIPNPFWGDLSDWYLEWNKKENKVAAQIRKEIVRGDVRTKSKTKTTGMQTIDLLADLFAGNKTTNQINRLHTNLMTKIDCQVPVFCCIDGSGSMLSPMGSRSWAGMNIDKKFSHLRYLDIAATLALTFMMLNPDESFRETFAWFSKKSHIIDRANFINKSLDTFLYAKPQKVAPYKILNFEKGFTYNLTAIKQANPMIASSTNLGAVIQQFLSFNLNVEELPQILLFITDKSNVPCYRKVA
jgi:hypothetical protein